MLLNSIILFVSNGHHCEDAGNHMAKSKQPPCRLKQKELQIALGTLSNARWSQVESIDATNPLAQYGPTVFDFGNRTHLTFYLRVVYISGHLKACQMEVHGWWQDASQKSISRVAWQGQTGSELCGKSSAKQVYIVCFTWLIPRLL